MNQRLIKLPFISEGIKKVKIVKFLKKPGENVTKNEPFLEAETDKACIEIPSEYDGKIVSYCIKEGEVITIGDDLCFLSKFNSFNYINEVKTSLENLESELNDLTMLSDFYFEVIQLLGLENSSTPEDILKAIKKLKSNTL